MTTEYLTVKELYDMCNALITNGHGEYKVDVWTGGYYDGYALRAIVNNNDKTLCVSTDL